MILIKKYIILIVALMLTKVQQGILRLVLYVYM